LVSKGEAACVIFRSFSYWLFLLRRRLDAFKVVPSRCCVVQSRNFGGQYLAVAFLSRQVLPELATTSGTGRTTNGE
jgi:hypothetical protein